MPQSTVSVTRDGLLYLAEGGQETEIMYKYGYELPHFAMFVLLENRAAMDVIGGMYRRYLDVAAANGFAALMAGLDYRASPDWAGLLGYSAMAIADVQQQCIRFLQDVARPYQAQLPHIIVSGAVGPRGDAYELNETVTEESARDYHSVQTANLKAAGADLVQGMTFNNVPEAIGLARAAADAGLPATISFTLDRDARLKSGPTLRQAIEQVDAATGDQRPIFYGINCSHPVEFIPALEPGDWIKRIRSLRPNAALMEKVELCQLGRLESGDPPDLGRRMGELALRYPHIEVWGGCCGTWDDHLATIAQNVSRARNRT